MAFLILVRHGQSEYNAKGIWTGWDDPSLTEVGRADAKKAGESIKDLNIDLTFTSDLKRAKETLSEILEVIEKTELEIVESTEIKERHYGEFTGKNKWEVKEQVGDEEFHKIRRSWDYTIKGGESMKQVYERFIPYYKTRILPELIKGKNILITSSGNSFRALVKYLDEISDEDIAHLEFGIGEAWVYEIDNLGKVLSKEVRNKNPLAGKQ